MTPSHRLKLDRADKHLKELEALIRHLRTRRQYPVVESVQPQRKSPVWTYRLDLDGVQPPETFPIALGDYLFNVRSALDHLIVGIAARKHKYSASFPICTQDPLATDETTGDYLDGEEARKWLSRTEGLPDDCITCLKALQPYGAERLYQGRAETHPLTILSALQNADKHRELVAVLTGLSRVKVTVDGRVVPVGGVLQNGAVLDPPSPSKVDMKVEGVAIVGLKRANRVWDFDGFVSNLGAFIDNEALPRLERFL